MVTTGQPRDPKTGAFLPKAISKAQEVTQTQPPVEETHDKFEAFHQPEVVGIRDTDTDEVIVLHQSSKLTDKVGDAIFKARELTLLDRTAKSVA